MRLLVSLCSRTQEAPEVLVLCDPTSGTVRPVALPEPAAQGVFGLSRASSIVYGIIDLGRPEPDEPERSKLYGLSAETLAVRWQYSFKVARDVHSIEVGDDALYAISTGTDELVKLGLNEEGSIVTETVYWRPDDANERTDGHHLNGIARIGGRLVVSGFGRRPRGSTEWKHIQNGFVYSISDTRRVMKPLYHPHSLCHLGGGELAVCESPRRRIVTDRGRESEMLPGYARGLCVADSKVYVGTSRARRATEPESILDHFHLPGSSREGLCAVCQLDLETLRIEQVLELERYGREVYDILSLS